MTRKSSDSQYSLVVGMGMTGFSIALHLYRQGEKFYICDTRTSPSMAKQFDEAFPDIDKYFGGLAQNLVDGAKEIYLSPGVSRDEHVIAQALAKGKSVVGDIELFMRSIDKPVIGITGSNGKSTVTTLVGLAAKEAGISTAVGGNIGTPALHLLEENVDLYVLELSSFQLESTVLTKFKVGTILNIAEDHMDRYGTLNKYVMAKQRIYLDAECTVYNLDDPLTQPPSDKTKKHYGFGVAKEIRRRENQFTFSSQSGYLFCGGKPLIHKDDIKLRGIHNVKNALALFAIAAAANIDIEACKKVLREFNGLPHRCELVGKIEGVTYINDSKATNTGACAAALKGLASECKRIILIAGGDGKGADFSELGRIISQNVHAVVFIGRDGWCIASSVDKSVKKLVAKDLSDAVAIAKKNAHAEDIVLLSPACASFDMFSSFEERGQYFIDCVKNLENTRVA